MLHPDTLAEGRSAGYSNGYAFYVAGRGGVLGDVDADVVASAFGPFAPDLVRTMWEAGVAVEGARASALRYAQACHHWAEKRVTGFDQADRFGDLAERVVRAAPMYGHTLFAGWRALPWPTESAARAFFLLHLLREWRGSAHLIAVSASGLTPLESILALEESLGGGPEKARRFGWQEPFPEVEHLRGARVEAEVLTDRLQVSTYESALSPAERAEFVNLVNDFAAYLNSILASETRE